jgi:hypothetical protein
MRLSFLLARVAARTGLAAWHQRFVLLGAVAAVGVLGFYQQSTVTVPTQTVEGDCADTTMAAVSTIDDAKSRAAYDCLDPSMRHSSLETFVAGMHESDMPRGRVARVGDKGTPDGGRIVFFTIEAQGQAVGYMVYLNSRGKVIRVE